MGKPSKPKPMSDMPINYEFAVDWKIYDIAGNELSRDTKFFETKPKAIDFAEKIKRSTKRDNNAIISIRHIESNEIVERFKKKKGNKNFRRG